VLFRIERARARGLCMVMSSPRLGVPMSCVLDCMRMLPVVRLCLYSLVPVLSYLFRSVVPDMTFLSTRFFARLFPGPLVPVLDRWMAACCCWYCLKFKTIGRQRDNLYIMISNIDFVAADNRLSSLISNRAFSTRGLYINVRRFSSGFLFLCC